MSSDHKVNDEEQHPVIELLSLLEKIGLESLTSLNVFKKERETVK